MTPAQRDDLVIETALRFRAAQIAHDPYSGMMSAATDVDQRAFDSADSFVQEAERRGLIKADAVAPA